MHWHGPTYINNQDVIHMLYIRFQPKTHNKSPFLICWIITNSLFPIMSKVFLLIPTIPKVYQPPRFIIAHAKFVTPRTHICNQLNIYNSCRDHAKLIIPPTYNLLPTCIPISPLIPSHNSTIEHSSTTKRHENPKLNAFSLKPSLRLRSLA